MEVGFMKIKTFRLWTVGDHEYSIMLETSFRWKSLNTQKWGKICKESSKLTLLSFLENQGLF